MTIARQYLVRHLVTTHVTIAYDMIVAPVMDAMTGWPCERSTRHTSTTSTSAGNSRNGNTSIRRSIPVVPLSMIWSTSPDLDVTWKRIEREWRCARSVSDVRRRRSLATRTHAYCRRTSERVCSSFHPTNMIINWSAMFTAVVDELATNVCPPPRRDRLSTRPLNDRGIMMLATRETKSSAIEMIARNCRFRSRGIISFRTAIESTSFTSALAENPASWLNVPLSSTTFLSTGTLLAEAIRSRVLRGSRARAGRPSGA
mmetsp:Transcript_50571/g.120395  ORF Transcript_50571/g.120395 Transcript_50571/m.120395 type:complete len:258 (+) Transcript_50571:1412-2185(+)